MVAWREPRILDRVACKLVTIPTEVSWLLCAVFGSEGKRTVFRPTLPSCQNITALAHLNE